MEYLAGGIVGFVTGLMMGALLLSLCIVARKDNE